MMNSSIVAALLGLAVICVKKLLAYRATLHSIQYTPGMRTLTSAFDLPGAFLDNPIPLITPGGFRTWLRKHQDFEEYGLDIISSVHLIPQVSVTYILADASAIKEVTSNRARFPKPVEIYKLFTFFGDNILTSEGEQWKRHRKIAAPAFSERNNKLVWDSTVKIMNDLFDSVWGAKEEIVYDQAMDLTLPIALFVIAAAGFGRSVGWEDSSALPANHRLSFKESIHVVSTSILARAATPAWLLNLAPTRRLGQVKTAFEELEQYMQEMIDERRSTDTKDDHHDLFTGLLDANEDGTDGQAKLTDMELFGNIFIFLLAGHETTAHTLCFTFGLLALYPDYQDKLYQQLKTVMPEGGNPTFEQMSSFTESMAVFYETLRLFPPVTYIPKVATEDTALTTQDAAGNKVIVPVPQGATVVLDVAALHYNPRYWPDPYAFKPERFHGDWPRDAFLPFSDGSRACLGRRFFETEGIAILTMIISRYKVEVKEEPEFASETFEQRKERIFKAKRGVTLTPIRMPLVFKKR